MKSTQTYGLTDAELEEQESIAHLIRLSIYLNESFEVDIVSGFIGAVNQDGSPKSHAWSSLSKAEIVDALLATQ